jgi:DNA polymerase-3 subunit alpha (Gram-positive type)
LPLPSTAPLDKQPRIIELGVLRVQDGRIVSEFNQLLQPGCEISAEITKITGITNEQLVGQPTFAEILDKLKELFSDADALIAHNAPFDKRMLEFDIKRAACTDFPWPKETICTVQEYRHEFGRRMKLTELYERKIGKSLAQTHRALDDIKAVFDVLIADGFYDTAAHQN